MKEDTPGSSRIRAESIFPEDSKKYASTPSYDVYISKKEKQLMVKVIDYHPGLLHLTKKDLEDIIKSMEE